VLDEHLFVSAKGLEESLLPFLKIAICSSTINEFMADAIAKYLYQSVFDSSHVSSVSLHLEHDCCNHVLHAWTESLVASQSLKVVQVRVLAKDLYCLLAQLEFLRRLLEVFGKGLAESLVS
jgi:hypothetical protein